MKKIVIAVIVFLGIVGVYFLFKSLTTPLPGKEFEEQGRTHVQQREWEKFNYNSNPPTSGPHDSVWTTKGIYTVSSVSIGKGHLLHSLEHGYIELHYNCQAPKTSQNMDDSSWNSQDCKNLIGDLKQIVNSKTLWKMIMVPNPTIDTKVSVAAWTRLDPMNPAGENGHLGASQKSEIEDFIDAFRDHGPEQTMEP